MCKVPNATEFVPHVKPKGTDLFLNLTDEFLCLNFTRVSFHVNYVLKRLCGMSHTDVKGHLMHLYETTRRVTKWRWYLTICDENVLPLHMHQVWISSVRLNLKG